MSEQMTEDQQVHTPEPITETVESYEDYWGLDETVKFMLPDGKQHFEIKVLTEGERSKFQKNTNSDLNIDRGGNTRLKVDPAKDRHELIKTAVVGWHLVQKAHGGGFEEVRFTKDKLVAWLDKANPKLVDKLEHQIRLANPFLQSELEPDDIREQIKELEEMLAQAEKREAEKESSVNR